MVVTITNIRLLDCFSLTTRSGYIIGVLSVGDLNK